MLKLYKNKKGITDDKPKNTTGLLNELSKPGKLVEYMADLGLGDDKGNFFKDQYIQSKPKSNWKNKKFKGKIAKAEGKKNPKLKISNTAKSQGLNFDLIPTSTLNNFTKDKKILKDLNSIPTAAILDEDAPYYNYGKTFVSNKPGVIFQLVNSPTSEEVARQFTGEYSTGDKIWETFFPTWDKTNKIWKFNADEFRQLPNEQLTDDLAREMARWTEGEAYFVPVPKEMLPVNQYDPKYKTLLHDMIDAKHTENAETEPPFLKNHEYPDLLNSEDREGPIRHKVSLRLKEDFNKQSNDDYQHSESFVYPNGKVIRPNRRIILWDKDTESITGNLQAHENKEDIEGSPTYMPKAIRTREDIDTSSQFFRDTRMDPKIEYGTTPELDDFQSIVDEYMKDQKREFKLNQSGKELKLLQERENIIKDIQEYIRDYHKYVNNKSGKNPMEDANFLLKLKSLKRRMIKEKEERTGNKIQNLTAEQFLSPKKFKRILETPKKKEEKQEDEDDSDDIMDFGTDTEDSTEEEEEEKKEKIEKMVEKFLESEDDEDSDMVEEPKKPQDEQGRASGLYDELLQRALINPELLHLLPRPDYVSKKYIRYF